MMPSETDRVDCCPLCGGTVMVRDSVSKPNLYSEKLAELLDCDEESLLAEYPNWRCGTCGLIFKRKWFSESVIQQLFSCAVPTHPRGWDVVTGRFSAGGFGASFARWERGLQHSALPEIRRGQRELNSIVDSIVEPRGFDAEEATAAIFDNDVAKLMSMSEAIVGSIRDPAPFKRFSGFQSAALWEYLSARVGNFTDYAELGCPLWGLLPLAVKSRLSATYLFRDEPNYWDAGCLNAGRHCAAALLSDEAIAAGHWDEPNRYALIGLFQYLDHVRAPRIFLEQLFAKADSAAVILDGVDGPTAIQHFSGWNERSMRYVAELFDRSLHTDFEDIRASGNLLYLFVKDR